MSSSTPRSSDRVLSLLAAVVDGDSPSGGPTLTELADAVGLAPSTTTRQLASLELAGFVDRSATGYRPGPQLLRLAHRVVGGHPLPRLAQPILDQLARRTGETAYLAVIHDEDTASYLAAAEGGHTLRHTGWRGRAVPRTGTAVGAVLAGGVPPGATEVAHDNVETGVTAVSSPVVDATAHAVAALSVLGPSFRLRDTTLQQTREAVADAAAELSSLLGWVGTGGTDGPFRPATPR
ncbi:IclR family transcriptional regulator [Euzebya tangerina]|uniref:IclR family transcriptional regulator n=1 Tax=Euzebya tangerina TaxID=591198 RepID=UPI0013C33575|nr:IclR family transcriptional regulator [Euzebya tangerina]